MRTGVIVQHQRLSSNVLKTSDKQNETRACDWTSYRIKFSKPVISEVAKM